MHRIIIGKILIQILLYILLGWNLCSLAKNPDGIFICNVFVITAVLLFITGQKRTPADEYINFLLKNIPVPAFFTDNNGKYISGNEKFMSLSAISPEIADETLPEILKNIPSDYQLIKHPVKCRNLGLSGVIICLKNIALEKELIEQRKRFCAALNHDLKTPVIAQMRSLEMLSNEKFGKINPFQKEIFELTINSCKDICNMIATILSSYRLENREINLDNNPINFNALVAECCRELKNEAKEKEIEITIKPKNEKNIICADLHYIKQAIMFLIENSISYSYRKSNIQIKINSDNKHIIFEILTRSPYIPEETLQNMLNKYLGQIYGYNKIGFCMKLNFCNQVVKAYQGEFIAKSKKSNENTLGFRLPLNLIGTAKN